MRIRYYISARENILYEGEFFSNGRYKSYGQHSFIYDFLISASRNNLEVDLVIDGLQNFPIRRIIEPYCNLYHLHEANHLPEPSLIVADVVDEAVIDVIPRSCAVVCIVHNAGHIYEEPFISLCHRFICMTETAYAFQSKRIDTRKLSLVNQGVDLLRFNAEVSTGGARSPLNILYYSRMNAEKRKTIFSVLENLAGGKYRFTVLGDGELFWEISDKFGDEGVIINHIPCHSIPRFISTFDVVISSGRGVMEACAAGKPTICAGFGYGGVVTAQNVKELLKRNLTGYGFAQDATCLHCDLQIAMDLNAAEWRSLAVQYFNIDCFVNAFIKEARKAGVTDENYSLIN